MGKSSSKSTITGTPMPIPPMPITPKGPPNMPKKGKVQANLRVLSLCRA
eukprot:CAMPEP_0114677138 /NCGR_PEP_ID=MMETSP0191-20121206/50134_1 /TAXON_ID=126664 /ORGANISM="Sorites sp." /LENGTH=48 /DNA_ID= /DNA_START= /DNA_END= /DNA_ORIENTATION=